LRTLVTVRHGELDASGRLFDVGTLALNGGSGGSDLAATVTVNAYVYGAVTAAPTAPVLPTDTSGTDTTTTATTTSASPSADVAP